mmetsp:Transcript_47684/g.96243  ORF Transcript_47684/g.96243 Transcript_47684/m.96243 type:complete len:203 (+) Transcript_47684:908-1516(+)
MHLATVQDHHLAVVLGDGGVALVHGHERVGSEVDDWLREVDVLLENQSLALPLVHPRWQKHGMPAIGAQADEALGYSNYATITMDDCLHGDRNIVRIHLHEWIEQPMDTREEKIVFAVLAPTCADMAFLHREVGGGIAVYDIGQDQCCEKTAPDHHIPAHGRVSEDTVDICCTCQAVIPAEEPRVLQCLVGRVLVIGPQVSC